MNPCPKCGGTDVVHFTFAGGKPGVGVVCRGCHKKESALTREAATALWNSRAEAAARAALRKAAKERKAAASALRYDADFQAAVLDHYVGYERLNGTPAKTQVLRLEIDGMDYAVNARAFVDGWLVQRWPELGALASPEAVVHHVLHDAGRGGFEVPQRESSGRYVGTWKRPEPKVGRALNALVLSA